MKSLVLFIGFCFAVINSFSQSGYRDEFNGPFNSWANVKTRFKAAGNGVKDDTQALQNALDSLSTTERSPFNNKTDAKYVVVYLPAGTYKISQTLRLVGKIGITIIGEDPQKTIIKWAGGDNDTMLSCNRAAYLKVSRITWDGSNKNGIEALGLHYRDFNEPNFAPTSIEFSDMIFTGSLNYGIGAGTYTSDGTGMMDAEVAIMRCKFMACRAAAIRIKGFNALDYWIWDSEFNDCGVGIECTHGNYHVYQSHFNNSRTTDISVQDALYSSVRNCYSNNAKAFSVDIGASCNAFKRIFQGNIVKGCKTTPIQYHHQGKISLLDNYFLNDTSVKATVDFTSWCKGNYDMLSVDNNFTEANPNNLSAGLSSTVHSIEDRKINNKDKANKPPVIRQLQPFVPYVKRKVFEVAPESNSAAIQKIINTAAALKGQRAIVHFPMGTYNIDTTVVIPAGSDIQLIGDGIIYATIFKRAAKITYDFNYFKIDGPSYITIKDLEIGQDGTRDRTNGFVFNNIDQPGSQARIDQIYSKALTTVYINQLDYTYFEKNNSFFSNGNTLIGGEKIKAGTGTSKLYCFGGQSAGIHLENNATMVAKDCWWEGGAKKTFIPLDLNGNGNLTVDGAFYSPQDKDSGNIINVSNYTGKIALLNMFISGGIGVQPNSPGLKMLVWNLNNQYKKDPFGFFHQKLSSQVAMLGVTRQCNNTATEKCAIEDPQSLADRTANVADVNSFINDLTRDDIKAMPKPYVNLAKGVSNIYISRVSIENGTNGCLFYK